MATYALCIWCTYDKNKAKKIQNVLLLLPYNLHPKYTVYTYMRLLPMRLRHACALGCLIFQKNPEIVAIFGKQTYYVSAHRVR